MLDFFSSGLFGLILSPLVVVAQTTIGPVTDLHITNEILAPDGFNRSVAVAGGTLPGPLIKGNKGDNFQINVINDLRDEALLTPTSIHWHGLFQHGTNWADGAAFVNQCPITTNHSFLYNFTALDQAGTFWYHSHLATQYCDGLNGPLVIYDPDDPHKDLYDVDDESTVISLTEWYHIPSLQLPAPPTANSTLINGLGRFSGGPESDLAVITVEQGKRYRFRLISMACEPNFNFTIDNHEMTVIEADGISTQPLSVDRIQIFAAQRYSFILNASQPVGNYWIRALPNLGDQSFAGGLNSAILRYVGAPVQDPVTNMNPNPVTLQEIDLHPLVPSPVPGKPYIGGADVNVFLNFTHNDQNGHFFVNNVSFESPPLPVLLQILSGARNAHELMPSGSVYTLPRNATVEVRMPGGVIGGGHPIHLHGHAFWVVQSAGSLTPNFKDPVIRDTVNIGQQGDHVAIRFRTDNPGPWFLHCHIDFHLNNGFAIVFAEDTKETAAANPVPPAWDELCPTYYDDLLPGK